MIVGDGQDMEVIVLVIQDIILEPLLLPIIILDGLGDKI